MSEIRHHRFVTDDGRHAALSLESGTLTIDIDWGQHRESWSQTLESQADAEALLESYRVQLRAAGFAPPGHKGARLTARAAHALSHALRAMDLALQAEIIEADLSGEAARLERAIQHGRHPSTCELSPLLPEVAVLDGGAYLWAYDDDGVYGPAPGDDPVYKHLDRQLARRRPHQIHLQCFGELKRFLAVLSRRNCLSALSHLIVSTRTPVTTPPPPELCALTGTVKQLRPWLQHAIPRLEALTLLSASRKELKLLESQKGLRHFGLWYGSADAVVDTIRHPRVEHLETLDFFDVNNASSFPFAEVLARRESLEHLRRLHLPGHLVSDTTRQYFADWPEVRFLSFERVEALGYDIWAIGYPKALR